MLLATYYIIVVFNLATPSTTRTGSCTKRSFSPLTGRTPTGVPSTPPSTSRTSTPTTRWCRSCQTRATKSRCTRLLIGELGKVKMQQLEMELSSTTCVKGSRVLVGQERHHRGLVRRDGRPGQHHQSLWWRRHGRDPRRARSLPPTRMEQAVPHDEGVRLRLRLLHPRAALGPAHLAVHARLQDSTQMHRKQEVPVKVRKRM